MGGLLPGVDVESQRPKILKTSGLIDGAHQRPNLRRDAKIKRIMFRKQNEILRYYEILDEKESLLREVILGQKQSKKIQIEKSLEFICGGCATNNYKIGY